MGRKSFYKQHFVVALTIIIKGYRDAVYFPVSRCNLKIHFLVKFDGSFIHRRGAGPDDRPLMAAAQGKEPLVQNGTQSGCTIIGVNADKVDIGLVHSGLGEEADQKTDQAAFFLDDERGIVEMKKKQSWHHWP